MVSDWTMTWPLESLPEQDWTLFSLCVAGLEEPLDAWEQRAEDQSCFTLPSFLGYFRVS